MLVDRRSRLTFLAVVLIACVGCDQLTKVVATRTLGREPEQVHSYWGDMLRLQYALNPGAFLGLGKSLSPSQRFAVLTMTNGVAMLVLAFFLLKKWSLPRVNYIAGALILGGGIGNLIDRVRLEGLVIDFLNVGIGPVRTGIFNIADMAIMAGCGLFLSIWWREPATAD
jgi:signal peptidase II